MQETGTRNGNQQPQTALEPIIQEDVPFHGHIITAVKLEDGRIAIVLRWVCDVLNLDAQGQVQRIQRTAAIAGELVRVKVQPRQAGSRGGGRQTMPALTLRGFPAWILGMNPGEVADGDDPQRAEHIRQMITAYQIEAVDVLYRHFATKDRLTAPAGPAAAESNTAGIIPAEPGQEPGEEATDVERATYYEQLSLWARWKADQYVQKWRGQVDEWRGAIEARIESQEAIAGLLPEIIERLGPETINNQQQRKVQDLVHQLHEATGKHQATIYNDLKTAFDCPRYQELKVDEWPQVLHWFQGQIERAGGQSRKQ